MLDCSIHPGFTGPASLPYFDEVEMEEVDVMLVTHFHLDHVAAVPYVATKTTFKVGAAAALLLLRVYMQAGLGDDACADCHLSITATPTSRERTGLTMHMWCT